jgi:hypothetical protein
VPSFSPDVQTAKIERRKFFVNQPDDFFEKFEKLCQSPCELLALNNYGFAQKFNRAKPHKLNLNRVKG